MSALPRDAAAAIAGRVAPGHRVARVRTLTGGVSATIHAIDLHDHASLVVRQHERAATEFALLRALRDRGIPLPEVRLLDTSGTVLLSPYLVMDLVHGALLVDLSGHIAPVVEQMADALATLHAVDPRTVTVASLPAVAAEIERVMRPGPDDLQADRICAVLHAAADEDQATCLLHGDFWPGNLLVANGRIVALIDWEDAAIGSPLWDVANARLELLWSHGADAMHLFTSRYASSSGRPVDELLRSLAVWDLRIALRPIGKIETWGLPAGKVVAMRDLHRQFEGRAIALLTEDCAGDRYPRSPVASQDADR